MGLFSGIRRALFGDERPAERAAKKAAQEAAAAQAEAAKQASETARQQAEYQKSLLAIQQEQQNLTSNNAVDLLTDTTANVVAGGTADIVSSDATLKKKKQVAPGMAAQLGINV